MSVSILCQDFSGHEFRLCVVNLVFAVMSVSLNLEILSNMRRKNGEKWKKGGGDEGEVAEDIDSKEKGEKKEEQ